MPTEKEVYDAHADQYERLILREDTENNLPQEINKIKDINGATIIELGAGTGRLTRFLVEDAEYVTASDLSHHMLSEAKTILKDQNAHNYNLCVANMQNTPYAPASADMIIAGWSFCYLSVWGGKNWRSELEKGIKEAQRILKPGGAIIIFENFGTGSETPNPPPHLLPYFDFLKEIGFQTSWFRTDYQFKDLDEAIELSSFFFGEELAKKVEFNKWDLLPECTAVFWKYF